MLPFQIATTLAFSLKLPYPPAFREFLSLFTFVNIDFIQCELLLLRLL